MSRHDPAVAVHHACRIGAQAHCAGCGRRLDGIMDRPRASTPLRRAICARAA
jgi:ribosomal protein L34E